MSDIEQRIEDLLVSRLASVMSEIEFGDPLPELGDAINEQIHALAHGMAPSEFRALYQRATERAHRRVLAILRAKGLPQAGRPD